jgi:hypothetical protein
MQAIDLMNNHVDNSKKNSRRRRGKRSGSEGASPSW